MKPTAHLHESVLALQGLMHQLDHIEAIGRVIAERLDIGARLLAVGNGGSAAEAQHLTAELVGRYQHERRPLSALALHAESSSLTAIVNDYGPDEMFARQVRAHGRPGDVLVAFSTSGRSDNVIEAVCRAHECGLFTLACTGPVPNPLAQTADDVIAVDVPWAPVVQEAHLVILHLLCEAIDAVMCRDAEAAVAGTHDGDSVRERRLV
ncbi:MAG TPA: SIS domain-containing protein [Acidimicrobiales bacterium]|nr:SIS domain-containing protein [Acidimicrobiales bacterium]